MSVVAPSPQPAFWTPMPAPYAAAPTPGAPCYVYAAPPTAGVTGSAVHHAMPQAQATTTPLPMPFPQQGFMPMPMPAPMQMPAGAVPVYPPTAAAAPPPPPGWMYVPALTPAPQPQAAVDHVAHAPQTNSRGKVPVCAHHPAAPPPPPPTPTYRAVAAALGAHAVAATDGLAPWEPEAGVVDLRLLLLKSRDMRRKLRVSRRHAARPLHLRNHNEVVKVERRAEFTAQLAAMDEAARACGMLPATAAQVLLHAEVFASQGFHSLRRRRQRPSAAGSAQSQDDGSSASADHDASRDTEDAAAQTAAEMDDAWSTAAMRPLFLVAVGGHAQTPTANTDTTSDEGSVVSIAGAAVPPFDAARNFAAAVGDGASSPGAVGATREAIHAALYRKFVLSAAHHANADADAAAPA